MSKIKCQGRHFGPSPRAAFELRTPLHDIPVGFNQLVSICLKKQGIYKVLHRRVNGLAVDSSKASVQVEQFPACQLIYQRICLRTIANLKHTQTISSKLVTSLLDVC